MASSKRSSGKSWTRYWHNLSESIDSLAVNSSHLFGYGTLSIGLIHFEHIFGEATFDFMRNKTTNVQMLLINWCAKTANIRARIISVYLIILKSSKFLKVLLSPFYKFKSQSNDFLQEKLSLGLLGSISVDTIQCQLNNGDFIQLRRLFIFATTEW